MVPRGWSTRVDVRSESEGSGMLQTIVVLTIVAAAAAFVLRRAWVSVRRARKPQSSCGDCGCSQSH